MSAHTWTQGDEQRFNELLERRSTVMERREKKVRCVAEKIGFSGAALEALIVGLKNNADEIRDALDPYDSGIRCSPDVQP